MLIMTKRIAAFAAALIMTTTFAYAQNGDWQVVEMSGTVRTSQPMTGVQLISTGEALGAGAVVSTGMNGRVVLARGEQQIVVGPSSRMSLPAAEEVGMTQVLQDLGTLLFKVDKRNKQHFKVETPIIAAVVKGTTFTVTAGADAHAVYVAEGAVEVSALSGTARQLVTPGITVYVSRNEPNVIRVGATSGKEINDVKEHNNERTGNDGKKQALTVPEEIGGAPFDYAELTNGLINGSARSAQGATQASFGRSRADAGSDNRANRIASVRQTAMNNTNPARNVISNGNAAGNGNAGNAAGNGNAGNAAGNGNAGNAAGNGNAGNAAGNGNAGNAAGNGNAGNAAGNGNAGNAAGNSNAGNAAGNGNRPN